MMAFNPASSFARVTSHDFTRASGAKVRGLAWDGTRFYSLDDAGYVRSYSTGAASSATVYAGYAWYDGDAGGTGVHETKVAPALSCTRPARSRLVLDPKPAPGAGITDPAALDKANLIRVYAGGSATTMRLQSSTGPNGALPVGTTHLEVETLDTGSALAPTASTFGSASGGVGRLLAGSGGFLVDGASNGSVGTGSFRDSVDGRVTTVAPTVTMTSGSVGTGAFRDSVDARVTALAPAKAITRLWRTTDYAAAVMGTSYTLPWESQTTTGITVNLAAGTATIVTPGTYTMTAKVGWRGTNAIGRRLTQIWVNGTAVAEGVIGATGNNAEGPNCAITLDLVAGDVVLCSIQQSGAANLAVFGAQSVSYMTIAKVA